MSRVREAIVTVTAFRTLLRNAQYACGRRRVGSVGPQMRRPGPACAATLWKTILPTPAPVVQDEPPHCRGGPVSDLPAPVAARLGRARWLDPRLVGGLLLVLLSVVVGARVLANADERVQVWSVTHDLGADTRLTSSDLAVRSVRLDNAATRYVSASQHLEGMVLTRQVGDGELLPVGAVARDGTREQRRVVVQVDRSGAAGLDKGRVVDVYAVREAISGENPPPPELVLSGVTVAENVKSGGGAFGGSGSKAGIALLVDGADVSSLIDAMAHGDVYLAQVPSGAPEPKRSGVVAVSP
jgi:hypothetical protein